jgi:hypothetical protein
MKKVNVILHNNGEFQGTYSPLCFASSFTGDMSETVWRLWSHDDFYNRVEVNRYIRREVVMPEWMAERDYLSMHIKLEFACALAGTQLVCEMTRNQFERFITLGERERYFFGWLVNKNCKARKPNKFNIEIESNFWKWLDGDVKYQSPLTQRQFDAASKWCPLWEAKSISNRVYYGS